MYPEQFGLSPTSQGVPEIRLAGCPPYAWSVFLILAGDPFHVPGPSDALWRLRPVKNRSTILPKRFLIGSVPEGWKEAVPLRRGLAPDVEYRIYVSSGEGLHRATRSRWGTSTPDTSLTSTGTSFRPGGSPDERRALNRPEQCLTIYRGGGETCLRAAVRLEYWNGISRNR